METISPPAGFDDLVKLAIKERPKKITSTKDAWDKFLYIIFMGGKRSDPEINLILNMLKSKDLTDMDAVKKIDADDWTDAVKNIITERLGRLKDVDVATMLKEFQKDLFRICASIKGSARFFEKKNLSPGVFDDMLSTREKTWAFIEDLAKDEDVPNIKYTKIIFWLHLIGYGFDFCPPSWQVKKFVNEEVGPYHQFYEDDAYFMKKAEEFSREVAKTVKNSTTRDVSSAIFYYVTLKSMLPARTMEKKKFTPAALIKFMKAKKLTLVSVSGMLSDFDGREKLAHMVSEFTRKNL